MHKNKTAFLAFGSFFVLIAGAVLASCATPHRNATGKPAAAACPPPPFNETLFLRGKMNDGTPRQDYAFQWRCNAYLLNVDLRGEQRFRINDAKLGGGIGFGGPAETNRLHAGEAFALVGGMRSGGGELQYAFSGPATIKLDVGGEGKTGRPTITVGPRSFIDVDEMPIDDAVALSVKFDSRDFGHKRPFGAIVAGNEIEIGVSARPGIAAMRLVIEKRRLEGWQEVLDYREVARVPLTRVAQDGSDRWQGSYRFDQIGVYGYYFEFETGGRTYLYTNNADPVPYTREVGSNGLGSVVNPPLRERIRRFRQTVYRADYTVPEWARDAVYYYIFPDRFRNGDRSNDPQPGVDKFHEGTVEFHKNWLDKPWVPHSGDGSDDQYSNDFFGGDLAGIIDKLGYIEELGANTLYINPIFEASSNHKYDTADYRKIDPHFGTAAEFEKLNREAAKHGIRVVLDTSLNHTGRDSIYFNRYGNFPEIGAFDGGRIHPESKYASWYTFYPDETRPDLQYKGWAGIPDLPELDKSQRAVRDYFYGDDGVMQLWLGRGLSGWRMDVAPWVPDDFWREWRTAVKKAKPDAVTVAESFFDSSKFFLGDEFDSTMNYIFRSTVVAYANGAKASEIYRNVELMRENYPPQAFYALMNLIDSHDSARALHDFGWRDEATDSAQTVALAKQRLRLAVFFQMTFPGSPAIYYGDEVGVTGGDDPFDRGTYPWPDLGGKPDTALLAEYKKLIRLRRDQPVLRHGSLDAPLQIDDHVVVVARRDEGKWAIVAMNNDGAPHTVKVPLPGPIAATSFTDALKHDTLVAKDGILELAVPAMYGSVLLAHGTAQPNVHVLAQKLKMPGLDRERTMRVYLPPGYEQSNKHYPVLYMHDGQNLFDAATSNSGEWGVDETLNELAKTQGLELVVVGVDNGGAHRVRELDPWDNERFGKGEGRQYMDFVVDVVKPYIDRHYRTKPGRANTAIMGSSLGGLISQYAIEQYPGVFGKAGVFSPAYWVAPPVFDFARAQPPRKDAKLYFYAGGKEGDSMLTDMQRMVDQLRAQGHPQNCLDVVVDPEAKHNESAWRAQFARAVLWLFDRNG